MVQLLRGGAFLTWYHAPYPFHLKLYSICFTIFAALTGFNILAGEPLNLLYYLGTLALVGKLGSELFCPRAGLLAAVTVGLWPSLLLHTTQLVKDPLYILGMLALIWIFVYLVTRILSMGRSLLAGLAGALIATVVWKARPDLAPLLIATVMIGAVTVLLRQVQLKRVLRSHLAGVALLVAMTASAILFLPVYHEEDNPRHLETAQARASVAARKAKPVVRWWQVGLKMGVVREGFIKMYPDAGSTIDPEITLATNWDIIRYLPRAVAIGFFSPFPRMWFERGQSVGSGGRLLSGLETLFMYGVAVLTLLGLWPGRRRLLVWMLFATAAMGTLALGLVVTNIGALYRLRYTFFVLLIILAAGATVQLFDWWRGRFSRDERRCSERRHLACMERRRRDSSPSQKRFALRAHCRQDACAPNLTLV